jgi:hypothetical protein
MEIKQGWQCPLCKVVHAPHIDKCECANRPRTFDDGCMGVSNNTPYYDPLNPYKITCSAATNCSHNWKEINKNTDMTSNYECTVCGEKREHDLLLTY